MLTIRKKGNKNFWHYYNDFKYSASDLIAIFDDDSIKLRSEQGRVIFLRDGFLFSNVTIFDDTVGGSAEVFNSIIALEQRLVDLGYPAFYADSEGVADWGSIGGVITNQTDLVDYISAQATDANWGSINGLLTDQTDLVNYIEGEIDDSLPLTTKGDLYGFSTVNDRLPIGADGQVLKADSTEPLGLKWDAESVVGTGIVQTITAGANITVDATDPANPIVSAEGGAIRPRTVTTASIATTYALDMALGIRFDLTLTANTTISISNLLVDGDSNQMYVTLDSFALTLPAFFNAYPNSEDITGATLIMIVWDVINAGGGTEDVRYNATVVI